jgi:hypothetical protein
MPQPQVARQIEFLAAPAIDSGGLVDFRSGRAGYRPRWRSESGWTAMVGAMPGDNQYVRRHIFDRRVGITLELIDSRVGIAEESFASWPHAR